MRTRFTWIVAILALVAIGFLMACSTKYSPSSTNGLVVVPTQGITQATAVMETFSLDLANGADVTDQQCERSAHAGTARFRDP